VAFVVAIHEIENAERFWRAADPSLPLPDGVWLHCVYPLVNGAKAVCLWEGDSADSVGDVVDEILGDFSYNEFYEVDGVAALGLPGEQLLRWSSEQDTSAS
jgi:hypothetical protein